MTDIQKLTLALDMSAPTPGPWELDASGEPIIINGQDEGESNIVAVIPYKGGTWLGASSYEHNRAVANAKLIAAVPRMLAALELVLRNASATVGTDTDYAAWKRLSAAEIGHLLMEVRGAIAEAKPKFGE